MSVLESPIKRKPKISRNSQENLEDIIDAEDIADVEDIVNAEDPDKISNLLRSIGCEIDKYMENIEVLANKGSASDSIILFGNLVIKDKKTPVAFKIVFDSGSILDNSLVVEQQIYINVIDSMTNNFHTPHLTTFIGMVKMCDTTDLVNKLSHDEQKNFESAMSKLDTDRYNISKANILILGKSSGKTLSNYMMPNNPLYKGLTLNDKFNILFQLLYTLRCFEKVGLVHNDLHMKNIFVDKLDVPEERIYYISDNVWVKILVTYDTKIFDFDRGAIYHPSVERNFTLDEDFCQDYGQCNKFESRGDLSSVIAGLLLLETGSKDFRSFLKTYISNSFFMSIHERRYGHLNTFKDEFGNFKMGPEITDEEIRSIAICLDKLIECPEFIKTKGEGHSSGRVYTLPPPIKLSTWMPTTSISHKSLATPLDNNPVSLYLKSKSYLSSIDIYSHIFKDNVYEREFGTKYLQDSTLSLFKEFIARKNVERDHHLYYMISCYIISLPFSYKFTNEDMIRFLFSEKVIVKRRIADKLSTYISDIWNVFNSTLPITMIKV